jgi:rhodanese-related sulfurtransferase
MAQVPELNPLEALARWPQMPESQVTLLDVREHEELELARLAQAKHIPMREIPQRMGEFDRGKPLIVMCHSGQRSRIVAQYLLDNGFDDVFNLAGGIDAWSQQVDPTVPRY